VNENVNLCFVLEKQSKMAYRFILLELSPILSSFSGKERKQIIL